MNSSKQRRISSCPSRQWLDISVTLKNNMVHWPGDPPVRIKRSSNMNKGDHCNISTLSMGSHTGTHMDAPFHFLKKGKSLDQMPLEATIGPARVIPIRDHGSITLEELRPYRIRRGERILFKTRNSTRCWKTDTFKKDFVYLSTEAAQYLAKTKIRMVRVDYLSVGGYKRNGTDVHRALLKAGIWIIEGLNLSKIKPGRHNLICLPLKILHSDGAPARAILCPC